MRDLSNKTLKELRDIAKELNIVGRWDMSKAELIQSIEAVQESYSDADITFETDCIEDASSAKRATCDYLKDAEPGTLVAFMKPNAETAISGKFVSCEKGKVLIVTKMGTVYKVEPEQVIWVKTGARWPRWVFDLFKIDKEVDSDHAVSKVGKQDA